MRWILVLAMTATLPFLAACAKVVVPIAIDDARSQLSSPKPRRYLEQTIGPGHEIPGQDRTLWIPAAHPDSGKRIVIRYSEDERLEYAAVASAGSSDKFDQIEEVLFDRSQWRQTAQTSPQSMAP